MNHIELFAGCGGLSLGLKALGFDLIMANELSPMAAETFAFNFLGEDLIQTQTNNSKTKWLSSNYSRSEMNRRLREDPRTYPVNYQHSDFKLDNLEHGGLVVGDIKQLNTWLKERPNIIKKLQTAFGCVGGLDLVSGGPPCQSFSLAGLRQLDNNRNTLPWEFTKFVEMVQPKIVLLENVSGILHAFDKDGEKFHAWYEIAKAFAKIHYIPLCLHINAKYAGVAQNRPRFILIGIRKDFYQQIYSGFNKLERIMFAKPQLFFDQVKLSDDVPYGLLDVLDANFTQNMSIFSGTFLAPLVAFKNNWFSVESAIDDLRASNITKKQSSYVEMINSTFSTSHSELSLQNHELRSNGPLVRRRFRIYQIMKKIDSITNKEVQKLLKEGSTTISVSALETMMNFEYLLENETFHKFDKPDELITYFKNHTTKKQTQRALVADEPAPAALSIPDDACHYHESELRTLTVREMARIQSFPDSFEFRSKVTTGGKMRQFEVPQYTQVGNSVPPLLGLALGKVIKNLIKLGS